MAVGGLPSKRQGRLGRPKVHRHPHAMAFFVFSANPLTLHLHLLPSSPSPSSPSPPPPTSSSPSPAPSSSPSPAPSPPSPSPTPSPSPSPPTPSPTPSPSQFPSPLLFTTSCETPPSQALRSHPTGPGSIPAYPYKATPYRPFPPLAMSSAPSGLFQDQPSTTSERLEPQ